MPLHKKLYEMYKPAPGKQIKSVINTAIIQKDAIYGVVVVETLDNVRNWFGDELDFMDNIAAIVGQTVERERKESILKELTELHGAKDIMMRMISHDLKNYLGTIKMTLDIIAKKEQTLAENRHILTIGGMTEKSLTLVKDILYVGKLDSEQELTDFAVQDINPVMTDICDQLIAVLAKKKEINVVLDLAHEPLLCSINPEKFSRVIENLGSNAVKFTNANGNIYIKTKKQEELIKISIKDSGIGIPEDMIPQLFKKYSKAGRKGTTGEESTGLGLYIAKTLIEQHGGHIEVQSEVGVGTEFILSLPLASQ
jgi:signal transduction histidine kinase